MHALVAGKEGPSPADGPSGQARGRNCGCATPCDTTRQVALPLVWDQDSNIYAIARASRVLTRSVSGIRQTISEHTSRLQAGADFSAG